METRTEKRKIMSVQNPRPSLVPLAFVAWAGVVGVLLFLLLSACAPGERLGTIDQGICICPPEDDAGLDAALVDAGEPDAAPYVFRKIHYLADSVPVYGASSVATRAVTLIKASYPGEFFDQAVGGRSLHFYAYDAARRTYVVDAIRTRPTQPPSEVWIALGYNDWSSAAWTVADFGAAYNALIAELRLAIPGVRVYCQTTTSTATQANSRGETLAQFDAAIATACAQPGGFLVHGSLVGLVPADRLDSVHLRDSGHAKLAAWTAAMGGW